MGGREGRGERRGERGDGGGGLDKGSRDKSVEIAEVISQTASSILLKKENK